MGCGVDLREKNSLKKRCCLGTEEGWGLLALAADLLAVAAGLLAPAAGPLAPAAGLLAPAAGLLALAAHLAVAMGTGRDRNQAQNK